MDTPLLRLEDVKQTYKPKTAKFGVRRTGTIRAVDGVTLDVAAGETVGLVGESGCGKSSLARLIVGLEQPASGRVLWQGRDLAEMSGGERSAFRRGVQLVFQDPFASLNPRRTVGDSIAEGILTHGLMPRQQVPYRVDELLADVGLDPAHADKYPHECSGGQLQRVGIARALALSPRLLVCDEPVSALDISVRAQVLNLLNGLKQKHGLTIIFIAHDLDVVQHMSDRIVTMYLGRIVEEGPCDAVYNTSAHPYTRALLSAIPKRLPPGHRIDRVVLEGDPPSPIDPPPGCPFHTRCYAAIADCAHTVPALTDLGDGHQAACLRAHEVRASHVGLPYRVP